MQAYDLRRLDEDQAREWLNRQSEAYNHNQNQAYRLIQLVIAAGSLLVVLLANSFPTVEPLLSSGDGFASSFLPARIQEITLDSAFFVGILFIILAGIYILDAVQWSFDVLRYDNPEPGLGGSMSGRELQIEVGDHDSIEVNENQTMHQKQMSNWLAENHEMLSKMDSELERSYQHLAIGVGILFIALLFLMFSELNMFESVAAVMAIYTLGGFRRIKSIFYSLYSIASANWSEYSEKRIWNRVWSTISSINVSEEMKGNKGRLALLLTVISYFQIIITTLMFLIWIPVPVSEYSAVIVPI